VQMCLQAPARRRSITALWFSFQTALQQSAISLKSLEWLLAEKHVPNVLIGHRIGQLSGQLEILPKRLTAYLTG
jgi:hypothetical protein